MHRSSAIDVAALLLLAAIALIMLVLIGHVRAEPMPLPKTGQCPSGYASEASYCVPQGAGRYPEGRAMPVRLHAIGRVLPRHQEAAMRV